MLHKLFTLFYIACPANHLGHLEKKLNRRMRFEPTSNNRSLPHAQVVQIFACDKCQKWLTVLVIYLHQYHVSSAISKLNSLWRHQLTSSQTVFLKSSCLHYLLPDSRGSLLSHY